MDQPDDNFAFDFFEEAPAPRRRMRGRMSRGGGGPPRQLTPLLRLVGLVCGAIVVLVLFVLGVSSCAGTSTAASDAAYMTAVKAIAQQSAADGVNAIGVLTTPVLSVHTIVAKLDGIAASEQHEVGVAETLSAPARLRGENADLVEALQLRVLGLQGLAAEVGAIQAKGVSTLDRADAFARQTERLLASDVVWDDLFMKPATVELSREGVGGVSVPASQFLADPSLVETPGEINLMIKRIEVQSVSTNGTSCAGVHGTELVSVMALPKGKNGKVKILNTGGLNTITSDVGLIFEATIHDAGQFQEVQIPVELTIVRPASEGSINKVEKVPVIDPGQDATVTFSDIGQVPFSQTKLEVNVAGVCGETNLADNSASYDVLFQIS